MDLTRNYFQRNSSWNAPYTFSGKEKDAETGYGYFGARYYDSGLSIWLSVDPKYHEFPSLSPYNYCFNNPISFVDPDGERAILRNKDGKDIAIYFMGKYKVKNGMGKSPELIDFQTAQEYAGATSDAFKVVSDHSNTITIRIGYEGKSSYTSTNDNKDNFKSGELYWNPNLRMKLALGENSPSFVLLHEMVHAKHHLLNPKQYRLNVEKLNSDGVKYEDEITVIEVNKALSVKIYSEAYRQGYTDGVEVQKTYEGVHKLDIRNFDFSKIPIKSEKFISNQHTLLQEKIKIVNTKNKK